VKDANWVKLSMANWRYTKMEQLGLFVVAHNREPHGSNFKRTGDVKTYEVAMRKENKRGMTQYL
jgi:hypothetical protein